MTRVLAPRRLAKDYHKSVFWSLFCNFIVELTLNLDSLDQNLQPTNPFLKKKIKHKVRLRWFSSWNPTSRVRYWHLCLITQSSQQNIFKLLTIIFFHFYKIIYFILQLFASLCYSKIIIIKWYDNYNSSILQQIHCFCLVELTDDYQYLMSNCNTN